MLFQWAAVTFSIHTPFKVLFFVKNIGQWNAKSGPKAAYGNFAMRKKNSGSLKKKWKRKGRNGSHFAHTHTHSAKLVVRIKDTLLDQTPLKKLLLQFVPWKNIKCLYYYSARLFAFRFVCYMFTLLSFCWHQLFSLYGFHYSSTRVLPKLSTRRRHRTAHSGPARAANVSITSVAASFHSI